MSKKLPFVKSDIPRDLRMFLDRLRELVSGSGSDRLIGLDELTAAGVVSTNTNGNIVPADPGTFVPTPPAPSNVTATAAVRTVIVDWDEPAYNGHAYAEVWAASTNVLGSAVMLGMSPGGIFTDALGPGATRYYWVRFVNTNNVSGAFNAVSGAVATTPPDLEYTMDVLAKAYGDTSEAPFFQLNSPTVIDGVTIAAGTYMKSAFIYNGVITNAKIGNLAVDDAKIANLSVGKLTAGSLQTDSYVQSSNFISGLQGFRISANGTAELQNAVVRGTVYATDGQFVGEVIAQGSGGNRARMWAGNFEVYKDVPGVGATLYKALSRFEAGVGANNVVVTIPGYFSAQPKIIVSPANIKLYDSAYANQSQALQCEAFGITQTSFGSMVWQFTPRATLSLAANTGQTVVNQSSGTLSAGWTSSQYTTPANTASISPNISLSSLRGTGTSGNYYLRTVRWMVEYLSGGTWVSGPWTTTNLGASAPASITTSATFTFPSAGTWVFRIVTEAYDTGGTFSTGTQYETATDNISRTGDVQVTSTTTNPLLLDYTPSYSVPSGWTVISITYNFVYSYFLGTGNFGVAEVSGSSIFHSIGANTSASGNFITKTYTRSDNNLAFIVRGSNIGTTSYGTARLTLHSTTAVVTRQRPLTNSTTASNSFSLNYYDFNLSSAQVLATGSLNWLAIGE